LAKRPDLDRTRPSKLVAAKFDGCPPRKKQ
jgi:hypothetical protein